MMFPRQPQPSMQDPVQGQSGDPRRAEMLMARFMPGLMGPNGKNGGLRKQMPMMGDQQQGMQLNPIMRMMSMMPGMFKR